MKLRYELLVGISALGIAAASQARGAEQSPQAAGQIATSSASQESLVSTDDDIVITAQKRRESLQRVPIAVTALTNDQLERSRIDGASNLVLQVPNLNFSRSLFGSNFSIRGIGNQLTSTSGDPGVGVHENYVPLTRDHLADSEFFDLERVEVLRGPQGTLYGRNTTGGVINVITAKPNDVLGGYLSAEYGNFDSKRLKGAINIPVTDGLSLRAAGIYVDRDGYTYNSLDGQNIDGRKLWSTRFTAAFNPAPGFKGYVLWEHYHEDDSRVNEAKKLCIKDPGPAAIGGAATGANRNLFSQGCQAGTLYQSAAYGTQNTAATILSQLAGSAGLGNGDLLAGKVQSSDLRTVEKNGTPRYLVNSDHGELNLEFNFTRGLTLTALSSYTADHTYNRFDSESAVPTVPFANTSFAPGGVIADAQLGSSNLSRSQVLSDSRTTEWTQELRLSSDFKGPINFTVGGIYLDYRLDSNYFIFINNLTGVAQFYNQFGAGIYVDPNQNPNSLGHNYIYQKTPYRLTSWAAFGEVYANLTDTLKITGGLRYSNDYKQFTNYPSGLLTPGQGLVPATHYMNDDDAVTGRANVQWQPNFSFTNQSLVYASYSRGYKAGGFNAPQAVGSTIPQVFKPEYVNAYEAGTKNTLLNGKLTLNLTAYYYDYKNYQISALIQRTAVNVNLDAKNKGLEFEGIIRPWKPLRLNATIGYLNTKIGNSSQLDTLDRTNGNNNYVVVKAADSSNCIAPAAGVAAVLSGIANGTLPANTNVSTICAGAFSGAPYNAIPSLGFAKNVTGNDLPNAPRITAALGAELEFPIAEKWTLRARGDYYRQGRSFSRVFNTASDRLNAWDNGNVTLSIENSRLGVEASVFVRNLGNKNTIIGSSLSDDIFGLTRAVYLLDPRLYGLTLKKTF